MQSTDQILLEDLLSQNQATYGQDVESSRLFELFVAEQVLKPFDLSYSQIEAGIVDGSRDGGIDSVYTLVNGELAYEDTDTSGFHRGSDLQLIVIQSKRERSFKENALVVMASSLNELLDFSRPLTDLHERYNDEVIANFATFQRVYRELIARQPSLSIKVYYATLADDVHPNVESRRVDIRQAVVSHHPGCSVEFGFLDARTLLTMSHTQPPSALSLQLAEGHISTGNVGYVCVARLSDYFQFITDEEGILRRNLFDANVRDYQGSNEVNRGIMTSLRNPEGEDFWWLNNGITIIASNAVVSSKVITIYDPQIVNGLQTSYEIFHHFHNLQQVDDSRTLLVRIIVPKDDVSHDRIIKATNSQTSIPGASLRATDPIQRSIEEFFVPRGYYYDRRKNYYKNRGKQMTQIISIPYLAQAIMAILLQEPDNSRARPSSLLKNDTDYGRVFDSSYPIGVFLRSVQIMKRVEEFIRLPESGLAEADRNNVKFHLAMYASAVAIGRKSLNARNVEELEVEVLSNDLLLDCLSDVLEVYQSQQLLNGVVRPPDQVAKSPEFVGLLRGRLTDRLSH